MEFSIVDIIVLAIIGIAAIIGLFKGFIKVLFSFLSGFVSLIISCFLVAPVRTFLQGSLLNDKIYNPIFEWIMNKGEVFNYPIGDGTIASALGDTLKLPGFIIKLLVKVIQSGDLPSETIFGDAVAQTLTYYILTIIAFIGLSIILAIVIKLLSIVLTNLFETGGLRPINRLLGFCFGALIGLLIVSFMMITLTVLATWLPSINEFVSNTIKPAEESFGIARFIYNNNIIDWIVQNLIKTDQVYVSPAS